MNEQPSSPALLSGDMLTWGVTLLALVIVWVPFFQGLRISFQAWTATRKLDKSDLARALNANATMNVEPLAVLMLRVLKKSLDAREHPADFVFDATRQFVINEYELYYSRPITMFASLLPPIGFIGTTVGMLILFISMSQANANLELSALAVALTSSIFALIGFAVLEGIKLRLYTRLLLAMREVEQLYADAESRQSTAPQNASLAGAPA